MTLHAVVEARWPSLSPVDGVGRGRPTDSQMYGGFHVAERGSTDSLAGGGVAFSTIEL